MKCKEKKEIEKIVELKCGRKIEKKRMKKNDVRMLSDIRIERVNGD